VAAPEGSSGATPTDRLKCRRRVAAVPMPVRAAIVSILASVGLEELLRQVHALVVQPPQGCRADGGDEVPAEVVGARVWPGRARSGVRAGARPPAGPGPAGGCRRPGRGPR
jgi:hypothetical protein